MKPNPKNAKNMHSKPASNNQLKLWRKLQMTKYRKKEKLFIAEGERCVEQVLKNGFVDVETLVIEEDFEPGPELSLTDVPVYSTKHDDLQLISGTETPQGVLAICKTPEEINSEKLEVEQGIIVALDGVQDPGNVGTIIRTAAWFEAAGILFGEGTADPFHPKVVRSTAGATGAVPYLKGSMEELFQNFEKNEWQIYLMDGSDKAESLDKVIPAERSILVIGSEGSGISGHLFTPGREIIRITGNNQTVESLNAAIALGIGMYRFTD